MRAREASSASFDETWAALGAVEGWLTEAQARRLWQHALALEPPATILEIGSYHGRSTTVLARAARKGVAVVAVDPHAGTERGPHEIRGFADEAQRDHDTFLTNLERAGVRDRVRYVRLASQEALAAVEGPIDLLYIDGAHRFGPASRDVRRWGARVRPGGTMMLHDAWNAVGVTLTQLLYLTFSRRFRYVSRSRTLAEYRREDLRGWAVVANAMRQLAQLGYSTRLQLIKVLLVLRLRPLAGALGHPKGDAWPY